MNRKSGCAEDKNWAKGRRQGYMQYRDKSEYKMCKSCQLIPALERVDEETCMLMLEIKKRKTAEDALIETKNRHKKLVSAVTDYIYTVKVGDGRAIETIHGPGCMAITGYPPEDFSENPSLWFQMIHEEDREFVINQVERVLSGQIPPPFEHRIINKNGSVMWVKNTPVLHFDNQETLIAYDGLISNITERKRIEGQLFQAQKMEALGRLASGIAHDFNNYLTTVIGFSELAMTSLANGKLAIGHIEIIRETAFKAADIARQLLAFSRKQPVSPKNINVNEIILGLSNILKHIISENISFITDFSHGLHIIKADPTQIEQIIMNMAVNAKDAMPSGGSLFIKTANMKLEMLNPEELPGMEAGQYVMISISDTGVGIPENIRPHIFEPFFTTKEDGKGSGLGLATVYGIVRQNSGYIYVDSKEGKGTTFKIYLPASNEMHWQTGPKQSIIKKLEGRETILLVEDDSRIRHTISNILESHGYNVLDAGDGHEALSILEKDCNSIDMIITDIIMPHMSGPELINNLDFKTKRCKVLYMSGHDNESLQGYENIFNENNFIGKPFSSEDLLSKIRGLIGE